jgi:hypothetical protein
MNLQPLVPWWLLLGVVLLALGIAAWSYRRRPLLSTLRVMTIGVLAVMLANPVQPVAVPIVEKPTIALVIDASGSMATADCLGGETRLACATAGARAFTRLLPDATIVSYGLRRTLLSSIPDAADGDTDFSALGSFASMSPRPQAVVLLSDGADWQGSDPEDELARAGIMLHTVGVGGRKAIENLVVRMSAGSPTVFRDQELPLQVTITATPELCGRMLPLTIEAVADDGTTQVVAHQEVMMSDLQRVTIPMPVGDALGSRLWRASLPVLPNEVRGDDNVAFAATQVVSRSLHLQVLEGRPWWDTTCAVRAWRRDLQLEVATSYHLGTHERQDGVAFPRPLDASTLAKFDVLVLGKDCDLSPVEAQAVISWVQGGGGLMLLGAITIDPALAVLDPLEREEQRVSVSANASLSHDGELLHGDDRCTLVTLRSQLRPQSQLLLGTHELPLVARRHAGNGLVLAVNCEGVWEWELSRAGRAPGENFWLQLVRELVTVPKSTLQCDRQQYLEGEDATFRIPLGHTGPLLVHPPEGPPRAVALDGSTASIHLDQLGCWRIQQGLDHVVLVVQKEAREMTETGRNDSRLMRMATRTNAEMVDISDISSLAKRLVTRQNLAGESMHSEPLVTSPWWFLGVVLLVVVEWFIRRRFWSMV